MRHSNDKDADVLSGSEEFKVAGLSRRAFLDRMKALGVGFGAAYMLGVTDAAAAVPGIASVRIRSNDEAVNNIIEESDDAASRSTVTADAAGEEEKYSRGYSRGGGGEYSRGYSRGVYSRGYSRGDSGYSRGYSRGVYSRGYSRGSGGYSRGYHRGYSRSYHRGHPGGGGYSRGYHRGGGRPGGGRPGGGRGRR